MTDEELVDLVCKGETRRFEELVLRHQDSVYSMAHRYARRPGDAEDIAQEVFLRAFRSLDSFRREAKFSTWLFRITANLCVDWTRRERRTQSPLRGLDEEVEIIDKTVNVESAAIADIERDEIRAAAERLPVRYREVMMMYYFDGRSYEDIGNILHLPIKTVETRLYRARRAMRRGLSERLGAGQ